VIWYFVFFLVSGFCGILYELIWLRLSMAQFGVTTPLVSIVLSMFMAGLGLGSWAAGALIRRYEGRTQFPPLRLYALCEFLIGISALMVPMQLLWGHRLLENMSGQVGISSGTYYLVAGAWLALTLIPWCACMGATIPLAMYAIRRDPRTASQQSFSFLYVANLVGAVAGALIPLLFIETYGFRGTLHIGTALNFAVALGAGILSLSAGQSAPAPSATPEQANGVIPVAQKGILILLFLSGLTTMGMEVVWIRLYTPRIGPMVYSFALILASYLFATFAGSRLYRYWSRTHTIESRLAWISISLLGLLPLLMTDLRIVIKLPADRIPDPDVGRSLVSWRSRSRWPRLRGERPRLHSRSTGRGIHLASAGRRTLLPFTVHRSVSSNDCVSSWCRTAASPAACYGLRHDYPFHGSAILDQGLRNAFSPPHRAAR